MDNMKCPKCKGEMNEGFISDINNAGGYSKPQWGTNIKGSFLQKIEDKHEVMTYRCISCGYLESYAK